MYMARDTIRWKVADVMNDINRGRSKSDKIRAPMCQTNSDTRSRPVCFKFCSHDGPGCSTHRCNFLHIDLDKLDWIRDNVPSSFLPDFLAFLDKPEVTPHFKATETLRNFLGGRRPGGT